MITVNAVELRVRAAEIINRVAFRGERVTVTRHGKPVVWIVPAQQRKKKAGRRATVGRR